VRALLLTSLALALTAAGCGGGQASRRDTRRARARSVATHHRPDDHGRCDTSGSDREVSEYDTSGDTRPDVRRVYRRVGDPPLTRLVLLCRESDLNGDGIKDVVRYYNDEGRPLREEADRNFDGQMDTITVFQDGRVVRTEIDSNRDGRVDTKIFYDDDGTPLRTERDLAGRSTAETWRPDRWEYFENGRLVRMGTDVDGDGRVDRWDRDHESSPPPGEGRSGGTRGAASAEGT
jgi:hypothetical protein